MEFDEAGELDDATRAALYERLYAVVTSLSHASSPEEVLVRTFSEALELLDADAGFVGLVDEARDVLHVRRLVPGTSTGETVDVPRSDPLPIVVSARDGQVLVIESNEVLGCDFPGLRRMDPDDHACVSFPIRTADRVRGAINVAFHQPRPVTPLELHLIARIADHCGAELERVEHVQRLEDELRRARALEIHDDVVQSIATAKLHLELDDVNEAARHLTEALDASKAIASRLASEASDLRRPD